MSAEQLDLFRRPDPQPWLIAAETALRDPSFTPDQRQARHDYYVEQARRLAAQELRNG